MHDKINTDRYVLKYARYFKLKADYKRRLYVSEHSSLGKAFCSPLFGPFCSENRVVLGGGGFPSQHISGANSTNKILPKSTKSIEIAGVPPPFLPRMTFLKRQQPLAKGLQLRGNVF